MKATVFKDMNWFICFIRMKIINPFQSPIPSQSQCITIKSPSQSPSQSQYQYQCSTIKSPSQYQCIANQTLQPSRNPLPQARQGKLKVLLYEYISNVYVLFLFFCFCFFVFVFVLFCFVFVFLFLFLFLFCFCFVFLLWLIFVSISFSSTCIGN